jgi:carbon monoxide dehydrogenase subunit G
MPEHAGDLPLRTTQHATFALPGTVARALAYLGDPNVVLSALPSVERVILRQRGTYRITLAPVQIPGVSLRPAAEVTFATEPDRVRITSIAEEPHALQAGEIAARITGHFVPIAAREGCTIQASLAIEADVSARVVPSLMPRIIAQRTAEAVLHRRMKQEIATMTRTLVRGYPAWEAGSPSPSPSPERRGEPE